MPRRTHTQTKPWSSIHDETAAAHLCKISKRSLYIFCEVLVVTLQPTRYVRIERKFVRFLLRTHSIRRIGMRKPFKQPFEPKRHSTSKIATERACMLWQINGHLNRIKNRKIHQKNVIDAKDCFLFIFFKFCSYLTSYSIILSCEYYSKPEH